MKKCKLIVLVLMLVMATAAPAASATGFTDTATHWGADTITWGQGLGIALGFPDGTFKPDTTVTEAQFLAMLERTFTDTSDGTPWYAPYYDLAKQYNYPVGNAPDAVILRTQVAEIVAGTQGVNYTGDNAIQFLLGKGLAKGYDASKVTIENYHGSDTLTRAQAVQFIKNLKDAGVSEIKDRPFEASPVNELPALPTQTTYISDVSQLTPALIQEIKAAQDIKADESWTTIADKYHEKYVAAIVSSLKDITYSGAQTVVVSKDLYYKDTGGIAYYRIIVNGIEIWDVGVGYEGAGIYSATPGWKVASKIE